MRKFFISLLGLVFIFTLITSFAKAPIDTSEKYDFGLQSMEFDTDGLYYAEFFDYVFMGHFEHIEFKREDSEFVMIFGKYLKAYGEQCDAYLPVDKVEIMTLECATEEVTKNGYGIELSRNCVEWRTVGTGVYARPDLYNAKTEVERIHGSDVLQYTMELVSDPNSIGNSVDLMHKAKGLQNDMTKIFKLNPGNSHVIKRFEENLKLFALDKPSIRMEGVSKYAAMMKSGGPSGLQNFNTLVDDLVAKQAETWVMNKYVRGSISGLTILTEDNEGRPTSLNANYSYQGFGKSSGGWVKITFTNGLPDCIYFFDFPNNCKTPSSQIVAEYAKGSYNK